MAPDAPKGTLNLTDKTGGVPTDPLLATVGDEEIRMSDFDRMVQQNRRLAQTDPKVILKNLTHFRLMAQAAYAAGLPASDPAVMRQVQDRLASFRSELMIRDRVETFPPVTDAAVAAHYQANQDTFTEAATLQVHELVLADKAAAEALKPTLKKENFSEVAGEKSLADTKRRGGNLGKVTKERLPKAAWDAMVAGDEGGVYGPFLVDKTWKLFLRGKLTPAKVRPLTEVDGGIRQVLALDRRDKAIAQLEQAAKAIWTVEVLEEDPSTVEKPDAVLFKIGPSGFTMADFRYALSQVPPQQAFQFRSEPGKKLLLKNLVQRQLFSNMAKTDAAFLDRHSDYLADVERQLVINAFAAGKVYDDIEVTEAEARAHFDAHPERFKTPANKSIRARHILIRVAQDAKPDAVAAAEAKIRGALDRVRAGEDFAAVAKATSEGPTAPRGGDLGAFGPGMMVPPFDRAVQELKDWEVSVDPVRTRFGFHIIRREPVVEMQSFTAVRAGIIARLKAERQNAGIQALIDKLAEATPVKTYEENLPAPPKAAPTTPKVSPPPKPATPAKPDGKKKGGGGLKFEVRDGKIVPVRE